MIDFIWTATLDSRPMALLEFFCQARTDGDLPGRLEPIEAHRNRESATITDRLAAAAGPACPKLPTILSSCRLG